MNINNITDKNSLMITSIIDTDRHILSFLDMESCLNFRASCKYMNSFISDDFINSIIKIKKLGEEQDLYALFASVIPEKLLIPAIRGRYELIFEKAMFNSLSCYGFQVDGSMGLKILGHDNRDIIKTQNVCKLLELNTPYRALSGTDFKVTVDSIKIFCKILTQENYINTLILGTLKLRESEKDEDIDYSTYPDTCLNDEMVKVLVNHLPAGQLKGLKLIGTFGNEGCKAVIERFNEIFSKKINPGLVGICGSKMSEDVENDLQRIMDEFSEKNPEKVEKSNCSVM